LVSAETFDEVSSGDVPDADDGVERACCYVTPVRGDGDGSDSGVDGIGLVDGEYFISASFHIPDSRSFVARTRNDETTVSGEVK